MKRKRLILAFTAIGICYLFLELFSFGFYRYLYGKNFSFSETNNRRDVVLAYLNRETQREKAFANFDSSTYVTLHPYLGFVYDPTLYNDDPLMTKYGLRAETDPIIASKDSRIAIVAIAGGSVAERMFQLSRAVLHKYLDTLPQFHGRRVIIIMLGREVYQQPQQLFAVSYYLLQGGRLDMLINLDGFNEIRNGLLNHNRGIDPLYPLSDFWGGFFTETKKLDKFEIMGNIYLWKQARYLAASASGYLKYSVTASTLWNLTDVYLNRKYSQSQKALFSPTGNLPYFLTGPNTFKGASANTVAEFVASFWEKSSTDFHQLAQANHFYYFHFLQPNQYVKHSKPFSTEEKLNFYTPFSEEAKIVAFGYPHLQKHIPALLAEGINVYDLTDIYKETTETVYSDDCCHFNQLGSDMLAEAIGERIVSMAGKDSITRKAKNDN